MKKALFILSLVSSTVWANAEYFVHQDWALACDNSQTCRAVGYLSEQDRFHQDIGLAIIIKRSPDGQPAQAQLRIDTEKTPSSIELEIDGQSYGRVMLIQDSLDYRLNNKQIDALVQNSHKNRKIQFVLDDIRLTLSDKGMNAVLRKLDAVQQRVGTTSAWVAKGMNAFKPYRIPVANIKSQNYDNKSFQILKASSPQGQALWKTLQATQSQADNECQIFTDELNPDIEFNVYQLSKNQRLVTTSCWTSAYNYGQGAWVMDKSLTKVEQFVSTNITDELTNGLTSAQKGRGVGDCWAITRWTWTGQTFVRTLEGNTGECRGFAGGVWLLPSLNLMVDGQSSVEF